MRITRLELDNFIGIYAGLGIYNLVLDLSKGENRIVKLMGKNGSGKSTIVSELHPFKETFDGRDEIILEGKVGRKRVVIQNGSDEYDIEYTYSKKPSESHAFIKKNGEELNSNGNLGSCYEIILKEMGVDKDYCRGIGQIGSNTKAFVDYTTADRKKFISKFLPDTERFLESFEVVRQKFRDTEKDMDGTVKDLSGYGDPLVLEDRKKALDAGISASESTITQLTADDAVLQSDIDSIKERIGDLSKADMQRDLASKMSDREKSSQTASDLQRKYSFPSYNDNKDAIQGIISDKAKAAHDCEIKATELQARLEAQNSMKRIYSNEVDKAILKISSLDKGESMEEISGEISKLEAERSSLKKSAIESEMPYSRSVADSLENIQQFMDSYKEYRDFLIKYYDDLNKEDIIPTVRNFTLFGSDGIDATIQSHIDESRKSIEAKQQMLDEKKSQLQQKSSNLSKLDILRKRPAECAIQTCPFIADALQYRNLPAEISALEEEIKSLKKDRESLEAKADRLDDICDLRKNHDFYFARMKPRNNPIYSEAIRLGLTDITKIGIADFTSKTQDLIDRTSNILSAIKRLLEIASSMKELDSRKKSAEQSAKAKSDAEKELSEAKAKLAEESAKYDAIKSDKAAMDSDYLSRKAELDDANLYDSSWRNVNSLSTQISLLSSKIDGFDKDNKDLSEKSIKLASNSKIISDNEISLKGMRKELSSLSNALYDIKRLASKRDSVKKDYDDLLVIKNALDPNKGIPLYFLKGYLERTKAIANHLLQIAFGDSFEIDFSVTASDFFIKVRAGENVKEDIKLASQGEIALTTISISLALMEQTMASYNILTLDEIDGSLDSDNRQNFIGILERQINDLGIEQVFVISHNIAFDSCPMDLILLKNADANTDDPEYMRNKKIIFDGR